MSSSLGLPGGRQLGELDRPPWEGRGLLPRLPPAPLSAQAGPSPRTVTGREEGGAIAQHAVDTSGALASVCCHPLPQHVGPVPPCSPRGWRARYSRNLSLQPLQGLVHVFMQQTPGLVPSRHWGPSLPRGPEPHKPVMVMQGQAATRESGPAGALLWLSDLPQALTQGCLAILRGTQRTQHN